jgi:hypothetical protein
MATNSPSAQIATATESEETVRRFTTGPKRVHPGRDEQDEAQPYRHPGQPGRKILRFCRGLDRAGADIPVHDERDPAGKNEDSGWH